MKLPEKFENTLKRDPRLNGIVLYTISQYQQILDENNLYFFEEYTDHGLKHIESVLISSEHIIDNQSYVNILDESPITISAYILSVILHDIGMHITSEGLHSLLIGKNDQIRNLHLDGKTWKELWEEYLDEARRFGDIEKLNIIGNVKWEFTVPKIENRDHLNGEDRKLIGEFIRRHHGRLAHEIAIIGFPTKENNIPFASELEIDIRQICGLLARSHSIEVRSSFNYLIETFQQTWIRPYNIELIYLMIVLRVSDYFQIDSSRTSPIAVKLKSFSSPISQMEHYKHLDVLYIQPFDKDPETIIFQCAPRNSKIFIKLNELFKDIQKELDVSWAILGEIYGKNSKERQPFICYRRVKSNIDNIETFSKTVNYIPDYIRFSVSNEIPKLLIGPLYGNDPTFGVRELLQNAVDSCREREFLEGSKNYIGKVIITLNKDNNNIYTFQIEDNGLGMSFEIIKNYFLEVGSSLRKSSLWKREFMDKEGNSKVQRSGKFGIGVLAAFLLGEKIALSTRDTSSQYGLSFETNLNTEQIEVSKINKVQVGTVIRIEVSYETIKLLANSKDNRFDMWYIQSSPSIQYIDKTGEFKDLGYKSYAPGYTDALPKTWNVLIEDTFNKVIWTYEKPFFNEKALLTCNGIIIPNALKYPTYSYNNSYSISTRNVTLPHVSIFDFNGKLSLNLSRNNIDGRLPFEDELIKEIYNDVIAKLLTHSIQSPNELLSLDKPKDFYHPAIEKVNILYSKEGFILRTNYFKNRNKNKTMLIFSPKKDSKYLSKFDFKDSFILMGQKEHIAMSQFQSQVNLNTFQSGGILFLEKSMYVKLFIEDKNRYSTSVKRSHNILNEKDSIVEIEYLFGRGSHSINELLQFSKQCNFILETKLDEMIDRQTITTEKIFTEQLEKFLDGHSLIPFDLEARKKMFPKAFKELEVYMDKYL